MRGPGMFGAGLIAVLVFVWAILAIEGSKHAHGSTLFPTKYDEQIQAATRKFWPDYPDWRMWKSQLNQESRLDPTARSSVGAEGLAQFMPATWQDIEKALYAGLPISRTLAGPAIDGGAYYMARLRRQWSGSRPMDDRHRLAEASFNAGIGSLLRAQKLCRDAALWADIAPCLPQITGPANAKQTTDYVTRIAMWRRMMN